MKVLVSRLRERLGMPSMMGNSSGMTLMEILIVVSLLATLMAVIVTNLTQKQEQAKVDSADLMMAKLAQGIQLYKVHNNKYPTTEQGLHALLQDPGGDSKRWRGPYISPEEIKDPWGNDFAYESDGSAFKIICNLEGGKQRTYPAEEEAKAAEAPAK